MELDATGRMLTAAVEITQLYIVIGGLCSPSSWRPMGRPTYLGDGAHPLLSRSRRTTQI
jgi:hypothetical protein